jgi:hypothetical protein
MTKFNYIYFLLLPMFFFGQTKPVKINILSVTSIDSIPEERKFTIDYSIENTTDKVISFFLEPEKLFAAHSNAMGTAVFYKLFQGNEELIINGVFSTKKFKTIEGFPDFSKITNEKEREEATKKYFEEYMKKERDSIRKYTTILTSNEIGSKIRNSKQLLNSIYTLKPKETKTYSTIWYWDKQRYFKRDEYEYYLDEKGTFYIQFYLFLMKEQYQNKLIAIDYETLMKTPNFIKGVFQSEKVEINFKEYKTNHF